jgi:hypothetical protein
MNKIWSWGINPKGGRKNTKRPQENSFANEPQRANTTKNPRDQTDQVREEWNPQKEPADHDTSEDPSKKKTDREPRSCTPT